MAPNLRERLGFILEGLSGKPETDLVKEWQRQANRFVACGFHIELGLLPQDYVASLPQFKPQPRRFKDRFDMPLLVETRIPVGRQCKLAGIDYDLEGLEVVDWSADPRGYKTPSRFYITWVQDGRRNLNKSVEEVRLKLAEDERGGTVFDGVAFYIAHPDIFKEHFISLPGTSVGSDGAPDLGLRNGRLRLGYYWIGQATPRFGSLSCGKI